MKKQQVRRKATNKQKKLILPEGRVVNELVVWSFSTNDEINCHIANELSRAIQLSYQLDNFGPLAFGIDDSENQ